MVRWFEHICVTQAPGVNVPARHTLHAPLEVACMLVDCLECRHALVCYSGGTRQVHAVRKQPLTAVVAVKSSQP
jgi:hypothetical protein